MNCDLAVYAYAAAMAHVDAEGPIPEGYLAALNSEEAANIQFDVWRKSTATWEPMEPQDVFVAYPGMFLLIRRRGLQFQPTVTFQEVVNFLQVFPDVEVTATKRKPILSDPKTWEWKDEDSPFRLYMEEYVKEWREAHGELEAVDEMML